MEKYKKCVSHNQLTEIPKHGSPWSLGLFQMHDLAVHWEKKKTEKRTEFSRKKSILSFICLSLTKNSWCGLGFLDLKLDTAKEMCSHMPIRPRNETLEVRFHLLHYLFYWMQQLLLEDERLYLPIILSILLRTCAEHMPRLQVADSILEKSD